MANVLSDALLAAQESASRYPLVEIKAGQFSNDLPLAGQRLNAETLDQAGAASVIHSSGRLIAAYTQDEFNIIPYPARSVKLVVTDPARVEFFSTDLFQTAGSGKFSDLSLTELADGKLALVYVLQDGTGKYHLQVAVFAYDGSDLAQYSIRAAETLPIYSPSICRTGAGVLASYIQEIAISAARSGLYTGSDDSLIQIEVTADGSQLTAQFRWKKGEGDWSGEIVMTGLFQAITEGTGITFAAGSYWTGQRFWFAATAARAAVGTITVEAMPQDGDAVGVGDKTYTWRGTLSSPAIANEVKIDTLGREICAENLRCAITAGTYEGTGEGVRYGAGTVASTKAGAARTDRTITLTALAPGTAGNSLALAVDGTRLKKTAFGGGAASTLGPLYWTPGSKLYKAVATEPAGPWSEPMEMTVSGILSSRKKLDTFLLRQSDGTLWLFFTYMSAGDTDNTAVYNLYYCRSMDDGATWSEATDLTEFAAASEIARRPVAAQRLASEIVLAYDSVRTSLTMDKSSPYWTDEGNQAVKHLHFDPATRKLYAVYGNTATGTKAVYGIVRIDADTWAIDRFWNGNTAPAIPRFFQENHVFYCHGDGPILALLAQDAQILILDDAANSMRTLSLEDNSVYGLAQNVSGVPWSSSYHWEYLVGVQVDAATSTLYFGFMRSGTYSNAQILTLDYSQASPSCSVFASFTASIFDAALPETIETTADDLVLDKENGFLIYCTKGVAGGVVLAGSIRIFFLNGGGLYRHYYCRDDMATFPYHGACQPVITGGRLYGAQWLYTTDHGQGNYWGLVSIDLATGAVRWHLPSGILAGGPQDAQMRNLTLTENGTIALSCKDGAALFDSRNETWSLVNNATTPGVFPSGIDEFPGSRISYDAANQLIFFGVASPGNAFTGVVAFPAFGKIEQTQYVTARHSGEE